MFKMYTIPSQLTHRLEKEVGLLQALVLRLARAERPYLRQDGAIQTGSILAQLPKQIWYILILRNINSILYIGT